MQEGIDAVQDVIYHLETYDVTTVRAATPMYLLARRIKAMGIKMVLTGEGSDEIFGGYLYFHKAPDAEEFHAETLRKLDQLQDQYGKSKQPASFFDKFSDSALHGTATHNEQESPEHSMRIEHDGDIESKQGSVLAGLVSIKSNNFASQLVLNRNVKQQQRPVTYDGFKPQGSKLSEMEWAGETYQRKVVDWQIVEDQASAEAFLERLAAAPLVSVPATSISGLIDVARWEFATNHFTGQRRVIDISADGPNSHGRRVSRARDDAVAEGAPEEEEPEELSDGDDVAAPDMGAGAQNETSASEEEQPGME